VVCWQLSHVEDDFSGHPLGTFAVLTYDAAVKFRVEYVAGFSDDLHGYSYLLTVQPRFFDQEKKQPSDETQSMLVQVSVV